MRIAMYGAEICSDCVEAKKQLENREDVTLDYRNIVETTAIMKEFLAYRDHEAMFLPIKEQGKIGIPFFILEDGTKTFDITEYVAIELAEKAPTACSIDGRNC